MKEHSHIACTFSQQDFNLSLLLPLHANKCQVNAIFFTYKVPANFVLRWERSSGRSLANPKSAIFGWRSSFNRILAVLISLCMMETWNSSCRYASPLAVPKIISERCFQLREPFLLPVCFTSKIVEKRGKFDKYVDKKNGNSERLRWVLYRIRICQDFY